MDSIDHLPHPPAGRGNCLWRHICRARLLPPRDLPSLRDRLHQRHHRRRGADQAVAQVHEVARSEAEAGACSQPRPGTPAPDEGVPPADGGEEAAAGERGPPCSGRPAAMDG